MSKRHQSLSAYMKWLEHQVCQFRKNKTFLPCRPPDIMKDSRYDLVPLHKRPDLLRQCCKLLNSEWKRSETARLHSLNVSCDKFPTCLLLLFKEKVLGHCKVSLVYNTIDTVVMESFIIDHAHRSQGFGTMLLRSVEDYLCRKNIKYVYLMTKGQEEFYSKNGYTVCEPIQQLNQRYTDFGADSDSIDESDSKPENKDIISAGPPPPPMPTDLQKQSIQICLTISTRTFMKKTLQRAEQ